MPRVRSRLFRDPRSPFWQAVWTDASGESHRQSTGCRDREAADAWLAAREVERQRAKLGLPTARAVALVTAAAEYLEERRPFWTDGHTKWSWADCVEGYFANSVIPFLGPERQVATITRADVERFRAREATRPPRLSTCHKKPWRYDSAAWVCAACSAPAPAGRTISAATVNRTMAALGAFGRWCCVDGRSYHVSNPWAGHEALAEDDAPPATLEEEQIQEVLRALAPVEGPLPSHGTRPWRAPWHLIFEFARETGLRKSELGRARRQDVDETQRVLWLTSTRKRGRTKSRKARAVILSKRALDIVAELEPRGDGLLFGRLPDPRRAFATAAKRAGLERVWLHLFRHCFASRIAERGAGRHELREAGGWSDSRMADRYTHARLERLRTLVEAPPSSENPVRRQSAPSPPRRADSGGSGQHPVDTESEETRAFSRSPASRL